MDHEENIWIAGYYYTNVDHPITLKIHCLVWQSHPQFRYASKLDVFLILVGSLSAVVNGMGWPMLIVFFADTIQDFVDQGKYENLLDKYPGILLLLNKSRNELTTDIEIFKWVGTKTDVIVKEFLKLNHTF